PDQLRPVLNRAALRLQLEDFKGAVVDYSRAIELNPTDADIYYDRGRAFLALRDLDAAIADLTKAIELAPDTTYYSAASAEAHELAGHTEQAAADVSERKQRERGRFLRLIQSQSEPQAETTAQ